MSSPYALPAFTEGIEPKLIYNFDCLINITAVLLAVSTIAVSLRVYVRSRITKTLGWDDMTMVAALVCWIVTGVLCFVSTNAEKALVSGSPLNMSTTTLVQVGLNRCFFLLMGMICD